MQKIYRTVTAFEMRTKISFFIFHGGHDRRNMKKDLEPVSSKIHVKPVLSRIAIFRHSSTVFSFTEQRFCEYETDSRIRGESSNIRDISVYRTQQKYSEYRVEIRNCKYSTFLQKFTERAQYTVVCGVQIKGGFLLGTSVLIPAPPLRTLRITDNIHYSFQLPSSAI